jgi:hypothetical protein
MIHTVFDCWRACRARPRGRGAPAGGRRSRRCAGTASDARRAVDARFRRLQLPLGPLYDMRPEAGNRIQRADVQSVSAEAIRQLNFLYSRKNSARLKVGSSAKGINGKAPGSSPRKMFRALGVAYSCAGSAENVSTTRNTCVGTFAVVRVSESQISVYSRVGEGDSRAFSGSEDVGSEISAWDIGSFGDDGRATAWSALDA